MFQVKATVVGFLGNQEVYPCHMQHKIGDEVIFDGESYHGRLCPDVWSRLVVQAEALHQAGPRYAQPASYYPFWFCPLSVPDPEMRKYDGLGFRNVLKTIVPPDHDMANLVHPEAFTWPPSGRLDLLAMPTVICPDSRTSMVLRLEAFDLSEKGFDTPFFRRQMAILRKLKARGRVPRDKILDTFTKSEIEGIYPALAPVSVHRLVEELEVLDYLETKADFTVITPKGMAKLDGFLDALPADDRAAFEEYT